MKLVKMIPIGDENRISRTELKKWCNLPDRVMRDEIHEIRLRGIPVVSSSSRSGYCIAGRQEEIDAFVRENESRIKDLKKINEIMRRCRPVPDVATLDELISRLEAKK